MIGLLELGVSGGIDWVSFGRRDTIGCQDEGVDRASRKPNISFSIMYKSSTLVKSRFKFAS